MLYATRVHTELGNIRTNLARIAERVGHRQILVAVKANAYGHGAVEVSRMIQSEGAAHWLGVATVPEALELRAAGVALPILKLSHARPNEIPTALDADLTLTVVDAESIDAVATAADRAGIKAGVHLKIDTGMRRIGSEPIAALELVRLIDAAPSLRLGGVFSHLPISDAPRGDDFTASQVALFGALIDRISASRGERPLAHLANSGAVLAHPDAWFDLVRPGIMVYGSYPDAETPRTLELLPGLRWTTQVSFAKPVALGESVGYGRTWRAPADTWIATIPVGYGDGYSRLLSNRGRVLIGGRSYPIVGQVCMDQTMIDIGPDPQVGVGDEVVLIGSSGREEITVSELAGLMGTIAYEVTCLIAARVERGA